MNRSALNSKPGDHKQPLGAISTFGVATLLLVGVFIRHMGSGSSWFFRYDHGFFDGIVAFPVRGFGLLATYFLLAAVIGMSASVWGGTPLKCTARRVIGMTLMLLAIATFAGTLHDLGSIDSSAPWGGAFGAHLSKGFLSLSVPLGLIGRVLGVALMLSLLGFGTIMARDWFFYNDIKSWLSGTPAAPAFALGLGHEEPLVVPPPLGPQPQGNVPDMTSASSVAFATEEAVAVLEPPAETNTGTTTENIGDGDPGLDTQEILLQTVEAGEDSDTDLMFGSQEVTGIVNLEDARDQELYEFMAEDDLFSTTDDGPAGSATIDAAPVEIAQDGIEAVTATPPQDQASATEDESIDFEDEALMNELFEVIEDPAVDVDIDTVNIVDEVDEPQIVMETEEIEGIDALQEIDAFSDVQNIEFEDEAVASGSDGDIPPTIFELNRLAEEEESGEENDSSILKYAESASLDSENEIPAAQDDGESDWASWIDDSPAPKGVAQGRRKQSPAGSKSRKVEDPDQLNLFKTGTPATGEDFTTAIEAVFSRDQCSVSMFQRDLGMTFADAAEIIERLEQKGVVGPYRGSGNREILMTRAMWESQKD